MHAHQNSRCLFSLVRIGTLSYNWDNVFKNGPSKYCGRQPLKSFISSILEYFVSVNVTLNFVERYNLLMHNWFKMVQRICSDLGDGGKLTHLFPMFPFDLPENIRKHLVFWCFQGDQRGTLRTKGINFYLYFFNYVDNMEIWIGSSFWL